MISYKSFQEISSKQMDSDSQEDLYCEDDGEYRVCCDVCDKLCIKRFYKNHHKSQTHTNNC